MPSLAGRSRSDPILLYPLAALPASDDTRSGPPQVLSVCPEHVQREIIAFLPELAVEEDYSAIVDALEVTGAPRM